MFHPDDDDLLTYLEDDGLSIEPEFYMPVLPLILVNGADGIGTGWSSQVSMYTIHYVVYCFIVFFEESLVYFPLCMLFCTMAVRVSRIR